MRQLLINIALPILVFMSGSVLADSFKLKSEDIVNGQFMTKLHEFQGFGCQGGNTSPQLSWADAPKGTKAFALFVHDADAPTGSGWWHWQLVNIPKSVNALVKDAGNPNKNLTPSGVTKIKNDYGIKGYGGACPPRGHGVHHYKFTLHALSKKLVLPPDASGALTGYMVKSHSIASSTIEALYKRD